MYRLPALLFLCSSALPPTPPIVRQFHKGAVHTYRAHEDSSLGEAEETIDYTMRIRCKEDGDPKSATTKVEMRWLDYHVAVANHNFRRHGAIGVGTFDMGPTGLPLGLRSSLSDPVYWAPLLLLYLPGDAKNGAFDASEALGNGAKMSGKGTCKPDLTFTGSVEEPDGKSSDLKLSWKVDAEGWPVSGEGTVTTPHGSLTFTLK